MRVEKHDPGSILHVVQRGTRGAEITPSEFERLRFLRNLFYANCKNVHPNWERDTQNEGLFSWPDFWDIRKPIVEVLAWTLMSNHFHLILREIEEGGIAKFMQRICGSMTKYFNAIHEEKGTLFQSGYKGRVITDDNDLRYTAAYVMAKNTLELFPGGVQAALGTPDKAWQFATHYRFSSLAQYAAGESIPNYARKS